MAKTTGWITRAFLIAGLLILTTGSAWAQEINDVPTSHWAYEAVQELVEKGYLTLEDGRFDGEQPVDRFTLASVVARILHEIETGAVSPQSEEDVELLRKVVNEFREELVEAYAQINEASGRVDQNARSIVVVEDQMSAVYDKLSELETQAAELANRLDESDAAQDQELSQAAAGIRSQIDELAKLLEERLAAESSARSALEAEVIGMIDSLREETGSEIAETQTRVTALEEALKTQLEAQGVELGDLQGRLSEATSNIQGELDQLKTALESEITQQLESEKKRLDQLAGGVKLALEDLRNEINAQAEGLAAQQLALEQHRDEIEARISEIESRIENQSSAMAQSDSELSKAMDELSASIAELEGRVADAAALEERLNSVEQQVLAMQSQIGLSEEQLDALSERLMEELESQFQHSFLLAGQVADDLKTLREEFNSYRQSTEKNLSSASQAQTFAIIGALLGLIGLAN